MGFRTEAPITRDGSGDDDKDGVSGGDDADSEDDDEEDEDLSKLKLFLLSVLNALDEAIGDEPSTTNGLFF